MIHLGRCARLGSLGVPPTLRETVLTLWPAFGSVELSIIPAVMIVLLVCLAILLARRRSRDVLEASETFNRAVLAAHTGEVAVIDHRGRVVAANDAWERAALEAGGPLAGVLTRGVLEADGGAPGSGVRSPVASALRSVLCGDRADASVDVEWERADGHAWSEVRIRCLNRPEGGAVLACIDVTARKRAELQVREHLHELSHLNMVAAVGELAASLAHELNQPLTAVLSNAQALRRMLQAGDGQGQMAAEIVEDIIAQDKRAGEIILRIRRLLRKESVEWAPVDVNAMVSDVCHMFGGAPARPGRAIRLDLTPRLPALQGDRVQLQQVVLNLVQNALHAAADGAEPDPRVVVKTDLDACGVRISVRDRGRGIPPDMLARVFEPFFSTKHEGLGLGLAISRSIVDLHRGTITAQNRETGGAEFVVCLPV